MATWLRPLPWLIGCSLPLCIAWRVNFGPVEASSYGVELKPKLDFGFEAGRIDANFGIGDLREGLNAGASANYKQKYTITGGNVDDAIDLAYDEKNKNKVLADLRQEIPSSKLAHNLVKTALRNLEPEFSSIIHDPALVILELTAKTGIGGEVGLNPGPWTIANGWSIRGGRLAADLGYNLDGGVYWGTRSNAGGKTSLRIDIITPNLEFNLILVSKKAPAS